MPVTRFVNWRGARRALPKLDKKEEKHRMLAIYKGQNSLRQKNLKVSLAKAKKDE